MFEIEVFEIADVDFISSINFMAFIDVTHNSFSVIFKQRNKRKQSRK